MNKADIQTNYYPTGGQVWEEGTKYVLSNGDEWGPSYHADFHAGVSHLYHLYQCIRLVLMSSGTNLHWSRLSSNVVDTGKDQATILKLAHPLRLLSIRLSLGNVDTRARSLTS